MGGTPLYCGDCPDAAKNADKVCEVTNRGAGDECSWTIQNELRWPTRTGVGTVSFANACDETASLGCYDIGASNCIRITKNQCEYHEDVYAFKLLESDSAGIIGDIYLQFYFKNMSQPKDVDCNETSTDVWECESCAEGMNMTDGHDVEIIGFTPGAKTTYGALPADYPANVYIGLHQRGGNLTVSAFHYTTYNNHTHGTTSVGNDGSKWVGIRLHIYNSAMAGADYHEWWADWDNTGTWVKQGDTRTGYYKSPSGSPVWTTDSVTFQHPFRYLVIGQNDLEGSIDFQITGIKVNTTGFPAGCTK